MTKPSAKRTCSLKLKLQRAVLPFFLVFIILFSANAAFALKETFNNAVSTATVKTPSVTLETGDQGTSSISATSDYASATVTAGLTFNENARQRSPPLQLLPQTDRYLKEPTPSPVLPLGI